jgi:hypothetical protein
MAVLQQAKSVPPVSNDASPFSAEEASKLFDETARRYMDMSGKDFLNAWDNGRFATPELKLRAMRVAVLIPLVRKTSARKKSR